MGGGGGGGRGAPAKDTPINSNLTPFFSDPLIQPN